MRRTLLAPVVAPEAFGTQVDSGAAASIEGTYTDYTYWNNYSSSGYYNFDKIFNPVNDPKVGPGQVSPSYFYSHQFGTVGGDGEYIGVQTDVNGKRAIFSWWGALGAQCSTVSGAICQPFSNGHRLSDAHPVHVARRPLLPHARVDQ